MKKQFFIILAVVFFTVLSGTDWAPAQSRYANPAIRNPIGPATVPQSSYRSGLFPSRNPIDTTGNLVITGNVGGGKHFQGVVPYNAISNFAGTTNSTTLDSFLRRSASSVGISKLPGRYNPYYSPSATVTTTRPGLRSVVRPPTSQITGRSGRGTALPAVPREQTLASPEMSAASTRYWPMRFKPQHLEKLILDGTLTYAEAKRLVDEQNLAQMERLQQDLEQLQHRAPRLKQSLIVRDESLRPFSKLEPAEDLLQPPQLLKTEKQEKQLDPIRDKGLWPDKDELISLRTQEQTHEAGEKKQGSRELDIYEQMKQEIESVRKTLESISRGGGGEPDEEDVEDKEESEEEKTSSEKLRRRRKTALIEEEIEGWEAELEKQITSIMPREELTGLGLSVRAKSIMGEHKTFASYSEDNFNQHMRAAEQYLKEGKYYRAADTYALASMYKRDDPLAYAGKSHALFAAGGYMSSALFLSRTLEIFPEYARFKVDLVAMVGDRDKVESRIGDIKQWIEKSGSAELQFLLGYVYYQIGRADEAKKAIDAAYEKLPARPAVIALKKAIDIAAGGNQSPE
ncbi:MAG: tetratricopeptide repeat protein [Planctomycetota bacterium]|jgi:tetratricopeptide (TPR) repeat protein